MEFGALRGPDVGAHNISRRVLPRCKKTMALSANQAILR